MARYVGGLEPWLNPWANWLLELGRYYEPALVFTSKRRSRIEQSRLYSRWQKGESPIPAAPPGRSLHEYGRAFDMARPGIDPFTDPVLTYLGQVWTWLGGRYGGERDPVHFEA